MRPAKTRNRSERKREDNAHAYTMDGNLVNSSKDRFAL